jgi:hypothetical protein
MPLASYPILCYRPGCGKVAAYKIAARWSDGITRELKTYALSCPGCLAEWFRRARKKQAACRLAAGETLDAPGIYELARGKHDRELVRREDLERSLTAEDRGSKEVLP